MANAIPQLVGADGRRPEQEHQPRHDEETAAALGGEERDRARREADPCPPRVGRHEGGQRDEPGGSPYQAPPAAWKEAGQQGEQGNAQHAGQGHVDAEESPRAIAAVKEPTGQPAGRLGRGTGENLNQAGEGGAGRGQPQPGDEAVAVRCVLESIGGDVERGHEQEPLGGGEARRHVARGQGGEEGGRGEGEDGAPQRPRLGGPHRGVAEAPQPEQGEKDQGAFAQGDGAAQAHHEGDEQTAPERDHVSTRCGRRGRG